MKKILSLLFVTFAALTAMSQIANPVKWSHTVKGAEVHITATTDAPYHIYDMGPYDGGPTATSIKFTLPAGVKLDGRIKDLDKPKRQMDDIFGFEIGYYGAKARWIQKFSNTTGKPVEITATVEWQACDENSCIPPQEEDFNFTIEPTAQAAADVAETPVVAETTIATIDTATVAAPDTASVIAAAELTPAEAVVPADQSDEKSLWGNIIAAILWGFAALVTPCVFPMIPMTVSFFIKGSENKALGRFKALFFGLSIIALYVLPIAVLIAISYFGGGETVTADIFNWLSTHWLPNIIFFLVFMIFAASFFGAFEITMPSKLTNKADANAEKKGMVGVFFMALTLVLVSFSCTGPIVGSVLVESTQTGGDIWEPIIVMFAFATTFALPFTIFALFPSLLKNMPKSGGWLNSVKVVLGFVEVAFGLKFLMTADQAYGWGILDREVYLALWIVTFTLLGFYLLGKLRFKHDDEVKYISVKRLVLALCSFSFVVYMIPGMWGAPLKVLSGYMPPVSTMDFDLTKGGFGGGSNQGGSYLDASKIEGGKPKYSDFLHLPNGLEGFFDYEQGIKYAKAVGKPVMIDFTGHGCVNCREVEANVWSDPTVNKIMRNDYVIIALYVDDKRELPENLWITDEKGKVQKTIGRVNAAYQIKRYATNAQPYYVLIDPRTDTEMGKPLAYSTIDIESFTKFLQDGLTTYKAASQN